MRRDGSYSNLDWVSVILYLLIVGFGYINVISASHIGEVTSYFDLSQLYGKHFIFIIISLLVIILALSLDAKFYERFSSLVYLFSILLLLGLFAFGKDINGARSWYAIGGFTIQPSEFAKLATALAVAEYLSDFQTDIKSLKYQIRVIIMIFLPASLILLQNDAGSTLVFASFFFVLYREGLQKYYLVIFAGILLISILSLKFGPIIGVIFSFLVLLILYYFNKKQRYGWIKYVGVLIASIFLSYSIKFFYDYGLKSHQKNRISIFLGLEEDPIKLEEMKKEEAYNLIQSEQTISSGGVKGKGFLEGTRTAGKFVPEQETDYIFSTVGEEWGFIGSTIVVLLFTFLILRILFLAEKQKTQFSRAYGYCVASIIFTHFSINIGMVMGLVPTIGIPLPYFSYGGSGLIAFTLLLFIFLKLDMNRANEW